MYINNNLRNKVLENNINHGFWDNPRFFEEFIFNLNNEFKEVENELEKGKKPTEVYYTSKDEQQIKPEGVPTEMADIIIFILDYFGGNGIDVDENFLEQPDEYYKNEVYYEKARQKGNLENFRDIEKICNTHISLANLWYALSKNDISIGEDEKPHSVGMELHFVLKRILELADVYGIDFEKELLNKIEYNNSRPCDYRKMGDSNLLEIDPAKVQSELLKNGYGTYKYKQSIIKERQNINNRATEARQQKNEFLEKLKGSTNPKYRLNDGELSRKPIEVNKDRELI